MALPSFDADWKDRAQLRPRIHMLEIRHRDAPDGDPIAWLIVERSETRRADDRDGSVFEASIRLSYERIAPKGGGAPSGKGHFAGGYARRFGDGAVVSLTSESTSRGAVFLDLPSLDGQRIGTYLMNEIVAWARQWPQATVRSVELLEGQAQDDNKARRNRFYEQFGLVFDYRDPERREGLSRPMPAAALTPVDTWKQNIRVRDVRDYLGEVLRERDMLARDLAQVREAVQRLRADQKSNEARPFRWALQQLWWRHGPGIVWTAIVLGLAALGWARWPWG